MIVLYELHWSHYCEKVRWALDFKKLAWQRQGINAFTKQEMKKFNCQQLVPLIHDTHHNKALSDSTPIIKYLDEAYPESPSLIPLAYQSEIHSKLLELDSKLGIFARRLGYTQIILEKPSLLAQLFLDKIAGGILAKPVICRIASAFLGMMLIKRFQLEKNEELGIYEEVEKYLLSVNEHLKNHDFLIGNQFTAIDLTLAVYLRPLRIIPFFREHPELKVLWDWQQRLFLSHNRDPEFLYETVLNQHRKQNMPVRRKIRKSFRTTAFVDQIDYQVQKVKMAFNDQNPIWSLSILKVPYYYFFKIRKNKLKRWQKFDGIR